MAYNTPDHIIYQGQKYYFAGVKGGALPTPEDFDLKLSKPKSISCTLGYHHTYVVIDGQLHLHKIVVTLNDGLPPDQHPEINGVKASIIPARTVTLSNLLDYVDGCGNFEYLKLMLPVQFTGQILVGQGLRNIGRMGYPKPQDYNIGIELFFLNGLLEKSIDRSAAIEEIREALENMSSADRVRLSSGDNLQGGEVWLSQWARGDVYQTYDFEEH